MFIELYVTTDLEAEATGIGRKEFKIKHFVD